MIDMDGITTVFFDVDDTLWNFTQNSKLALRATYDEYKLERYFGSYDKFKQLYFGCNDALWTQYRQGAITSAFLKVERFKQPLAQVGYDDAGYALSSRLNEYYLDVLARQPLLMPGAKDVLRYLTGKGYDVNVLSNGFTGTQLKKLQSGGIDGYINKVIVSEDCGMTKPQRSIFAYALAQCGAVEQRAVMVGDDPAADVEGAHHAGWHSVYYNWRGKNVAPGIADAVISNLGQLKSLL